MGVVILGVTLQKPQPLDYSLIGFSISNFGPQLINYHVSQDILRLLLCISSAVGSAIDQRHAVNFLLYHPHLESLLK